MFEHERGEVSIFSKRQQVLLMEGVNIIIGIGSDYLVGNDQRFSLVSRA